MLKRKHLKTAILSTVLSLGMCLFTISNAFAGTYTVVANDSLYKISKALGTSVQTIVNDNKLSGSMIYPGQKLYIACKTYTVQNGDTLYLIAKKYGITLYNLRRANNIWVDRLNIGQVLNIPIAISTTPIVQSKAISYSSLDVDLLARLIMAEAQGVSYNSKVAVGAVVVNRVKSTVFPNTVKEVIYQRINGYYQFTPVLNGWINKPADQDSIKAAYAALNGSDPTNGALFYFDNTVTNSWLLAKPVALRLDNLTFSY